MTKKKLLKLSLVCLIIGLAVLAIAYFFFHFVTDDGITLVWHPEAGKPFVTDMIGQLGTLFLFSSAFSAVSAVIFFDEEK
jgi:hypothetical protein